MALEQPETTFLARERYRLIDVLGRGGMATVYRAYDSRLDVVRAIKVLAPEYVDNSRLRARFESEARTMAKLHHPNIVTVHDVGREGMRIFIVMELLRGGSVMEHVRRYGPMPARMCSQVIQSTLRAVQFAHSKGVIHRDIKPHNILIEANGIPKITDFGIAHVSQQGSSLTRTGAVMGTYAYMPPEQRLSARRVDARSDVYAIGASLYVMLTDQEPQELFDEEHRADLLQGVQPLLAEIITLATQADKEDRYGSAADMHAALREIHELLPQEDGTYPPLGTLLTGDELPRDISRESIPIKDIGGPKTSMTISDWSEGKEPDLYLVPPQRRTVPDHKETSLMDDVSLVHEPEREPDEAPAGQPLPRILAVIGLCLGLTLLLAWGVWQVAPTNELPSTNPAVWAPDELTATAAVPKDESTPTGSPNPTVADKVASPKEPIEPDKPPIKAAASKEPPETTTQTTTQKTTETTSQTTKAKAPEPEPDVEPVAATAEPPPVGPVGEVFLNTRPQAKVLIDGVARGTTSWKGVLGLGPHQIEFVLDGQRKSHRLIVYGEEMNRFCWDFTLESECPR